MTQSPTEDPWQRRGLVAAPHTPFRPDGRLHLEAVEPQAAFLAARGVRGVFIAGSTGEGAALDRGERRALLEAWGPAARNAGLHLWVHVGSDNMREARELAQHAQAQGADAIAYLPSRYFRPGSVEELVDWCAAISSAAPELPAYLYDIPAISGVELPTERFLDLGAARIPNLAGIKYSRPDSLLQQRLLAADGGRYEVLHGIDETLLTGLALGVHGAVGSTYNFATPLALRIAEDFAAGRWQAARAGQWKLVRLVDALVPFGYLAAARALMGLLGVELGPPRAPHRPLDDAAIQRLEAAVDELELP